MKPLERISIILILCLTLLAAVWLHGILNRYEVVVHSDSSMSVTRYDRVTGRVWWIHQDDTYELGVKGVWWTK